MRETLVIARREVTRLRTRFRGRARLVIGLVLGLAAFMSWFISQQGFMPTAGFYTAGVSPASPPIADARFRTVVVQPADAAALLRQGRIDIYLNGERVIWRSDRRSRAAAGALRQALERQELFRLACQYDIDRAFPLRVEVHRVPAPGTDVIAAASTSSPWHLADPRAGTDQPAPATDAPAGTSSAVVRGLEGLRGNQASLPDFQAEFVSDSEVIIPSLMEPPLPLAQVVLAFLYVLPIIFASVFFTSSFMEEKLQRKLNILLSAPVTPLQIIIGKMLPYLAYSILSTVVITLLLGGNVPLALAIFVPLALFILAVYLMVALLYRTFKDQTFFSLLAVTAITVYLVFPSMFSGVNDISQVSPLSLAIQMYKGESFGPAEYLLATTPLYLVFGTSLFVGTRIFNEEYLLTFRPLYRKLADAVSLVINRHHRHLSIFLLGLCVIPGVFMVQLGGIAVAFNLPLPASLIGVLAASVIVEEVAKSAGIAVLIKNGLVGSVRSVATLSAAAALGFFAGEKLLLFVTLKVISESMFTAAVFGSGLLVMPLLAHFAFTFVVCLATQRFGVKRYPLAVLGGALLHALYNLAVMGVMS